MKRLVLVLGAFGVVSFGALAGGLPVAAYQPATQEELSVTQDVGPPSYGFEAILTGCYPGEPVVFSIYDRADLPSDPSLPPTAPPVTDKIADCDLEAIDAVATFTAPSVDGFYVVRAHMDPYVTVNPDVPDRVGALDLDAFIKVGENLVVINPGGGVGQAEGVTVGTSGERWHDVVFSAGVLRTFFGLLALLVALGLVLLWRRRSENDRIYGTPPAGAGPPPDSQHPRLA